ncbi:MAG: DNA repair protein RecN [Bergeyella sp.]
MLSRIFIQNFALIDTLEIGMHKGLQVITGETGAGKSIILGALRLILGERADLKSISNSENKSIVEAEFRVSESLKSFFEENDLDFEDNTIIRREILTSGKSRAFVNDVPVTLDILKELSEKLIDIHSQFETSNLFNEAYQFKIIDGLGENKTLPEQYLNEFLEYRKLRKSLEELKNKRENGNKDEDYKNYLMEELNEANLDESDLEELQKKLSLQENVGQISEHFGSILGRFDREEIGILDSLNEVRNRLSKISELSIHFEELSRRFEENFVELKDILFEIQNEAENIETNPELLEELSSKVNKINALLLKHKVNSVEELIEIRDTFAGEQIGFEELDQYIAETEKNIAEKKSLLEKSAKELSSERKKSRKIFAEKMDSLLKQLGLEKAKIEVQLTPTEDFTQFGKEKIEILFQANSGFPMKPIQSAISGGERSRVMLAVKKIMAENAELPTLILDEIDTGVSGKIADEMGKVMKEMSEDMQLIVITHLAQVAAKGDYNYKVVKKEFSGKTQSDIVPLNQEEKLHEIAQLLSGATITDAAMKQAEELMK